MQKLRRKPMENLHNFKKGTIRALGITAAMATSIAMTGCTTTSNIDNSEDTENHPTFERLYGDIKSDYLSICIENKNTRVTDDNCLDSTSKTTQWYYKPLYYNEISPLPPLNTPIDLEEEGLVETTATGKKSIKTDKANIPLEEDENVTLYVQAAEGHGFDYKETQVEADYVEICVDADGNRVDDTECSVGEMPTNNNQPTHSSGGGGFFFLWLPTMSGSNNYVPPVGSKVNTTNAIKDKSQISGKKIQKAPRQGLTKTQLNRGNSVNNKSSNSGKSNGNVSRGGFGSSGKAGG